MSTSSATLISPPPAPSGPSQEEIKKVIADYKAREEKKGAKSDDKDKDKKEDKEKEIPKPASPIPSTPAPPSASHRKFALHRQIFEMRRDDIKRKEQGVKAREVGKVRSRLFRICDGELICRSAAGAEGDVLGFSSSPYRYHWLRRKSDIGMASNLAAQAEERDRYLVLGSRRRSIFVTTRPISTTIHILFFIYTKSVTMKPLL